MNINECIYERDEEKEVKQEKVQEVKKRKYRFTHSYSNKKKYFVCTLNCNDRS